MRPHVRLRILLLATCAAFPALLSACGDERSPGSDSAVEAPPPSVNPELGVDPATVTTRAPVVKRLLILALDGATWDLLDPVLERGGAPTMAGLIERGVRAELITLEPTVSPAIWTTIATGFLPDQHGILGFDGVPGATMTTLPNARMRKKKTFWNILSDFGVTTGTLGWWASWPADPLCDGSFLVSDRVPYTRMEASIGRGALDDDDVFPPSLLDTLAPLVEKPNDLSPAVARDWLGMDDEERERFLLDPEYRMGRFLPEFKFAYQSDLSTRKMAVAAYDHLPVQVLSVYFTGIDTVSHLFWHFTFPEEFPNQPVAAAQAARYGAVIPKYYEQVDRWLGEILATLGDDTTVLIVSDHGFGGTGNLPWSGGHGRLTPGAPIAPRGLLVLSGPGIVDGPVRLDRAHVLDVAPTILRLMGLPEADDMVGRPLESALVPAAREELPNVASFEVIGHLRRPPPPRVDPSGDAERMERLRALGYIR
ncbi:MAG: alkaline phosphatase family protein [Gemmatimonadetes bacterium]|nr:alkaline phosphatase family protein [Gemmatimonadota bacterium]